MKYILTSILITLWFVSPASAQMFCFTEGAKDIEKSIQEYNEEFVFSGVTTAGTPITIYKGKDTFTILFITNEGKLCTGPDYTGNIIPKLKLNNEKGT
tara:strand:- start:93 stop:386 length:294 start_codon:yes stop_codon:yes gene_type:complete